MFDPRGKAKVQDAEYWDSRVVPMLASISWICTDISRVNKLLRRAVKMRLAAGWEEDEEVAWMIWQDTANVHYDFWGGEGGG